MIFQNIKNIINNIKNSIERFLESLNLSIFDIIRFISCFGIGFLIGIFLRWYAKYFVLFIISTLLSLLFLQYFNFIIINYSYMKSLLGFSESATFEMMMHSLCVVIKMYSIEVICSVLGCLLGFKIG
ncbi:hypothetical protein HYV11_02870 [Candidatus Dependentiae bacterium]|nr:hypothetical protein [Candidatus Dependentiae bacterium]